MTTATQHIEAVVDGLEQKANPDWLEEAYRALVLVAHSRREFTTDAIWDQLGEWEVPYPQSPRAISGVVRRAQKEALIASTERYERSNRKSCSYRPILVWRSLVFR